MGFEHLDARGRQWSAEASFRKIKARIIHADSKKRMPLGGNLPDSMRQTLYHWLNEQLGE